MKNSYIAVLVFVFFHFLAQGQPIPDLTWIQKKPLIFKQEQKQITNIQTQFLQVKKYFAQYQQYWQNVEANKKLLQTIRHKRRLRRIIKKDSTKAIENFLKAKELCFTQYAVLKSILDKKAQQLYKTNFTKLPDLNIKLYDTISKRLNALEQNIVLQTNKLKKIANPAQQVAQYRVVCSLNKQKIALYEELFTILTVTDAKKLAQLSQKYKITKTQGPGAKQPQKTTQPKQPQKTTPPKQPKQSKIVQISYKCNYPKADYIFTFLHDSTLLNTQQKQKLQKILQTRQNIQKYEAKLKNISDPDIKTAVKRSLALDYYAMFKDLYQLYLEKLAEKKLTQPIFNQITHTAQIFFDKYQQSGNLNHLWQSTVYYAYGCQTAYNTLSGKKQKLQLPLISQPKSRKPVKTKPQKPKQLKKQAKTTKPKAPKPQTSLCQTVYQYYKTNHVRKLQHNGTVYRIFVGNYSTLLIPTAWSQFLPITYIPLCNSKLKKFYVGQYSDFATAKQAALKIINSPKYKDLKSRIRIVKFVKNKPVEYYKPTASVQKHSKPTQSKSTYIVQVGSYSNQLSDKEFQKVFSKINKFNIQMRKINNRYIYYIPAKDYKTAVSILNQVKKLGFSDAFIRKF